MSIVFNLNQIQKLQFSDKAAAEKMLLEFLRKNQDPEITKIELLPKPESLNSVNGFVTYSDQKKLFFKSHTEEGEKLDEYYNAVLLAEAGYPVFSSKKIETQPGQQIVLYEIIDLPTLFDLVKQEEDSASKGSATKLGERLVRAQRALDERTFGIYQATYQDISAAEHARAPVHQLFVHRLESSGRIAKFYSGKSIELNGRVVPFEALAVKRWIVNGVEYKENLNELIERSRCYLVPAAGPSIIGHGDAHNGNVFADIAKEKLFLSTLHLQEDIIR